MPAELHALALRWTREVFNERRVATIDEMMHPECIVSVEGVEGDLGREELKRYWTAFINAVPDLHVEVLTLTFEGETGFMHWRARGTHGGEGLGIPPSGRRVDFSGISMFQFRDGLIVRGMDRWNRGEVIASLLQVRIDELKDQFHLTTREAQVALLMAERYTHLEIADQLGIRPNTARRHSERVISKLGVRRKQDVARALGKVPGSVLTRHGSDLPT